MKYSRQTSYATQLPLKYTNWTWCICAGIQKWYRFIWMKLYSFATKLWQETEYDLSSQTTDYPLLEMQMKLSTRKIYLLDENIRSVPFFYDFIKMIFSVRKLFFSATFIHVKYYYSSCLSYFFYFSFMRS